LANAVVKNSVFMHGGFKTMKEAKAKAETATKSSRYTEKQKTVTNFVFVFHKMCDLRRRPTHGAL